MPWFVIVMLAYQAINILYLVYKIDGEIEITPTYVIAAMLFNGLWAWGLIAAAN